MFRSWKTRKPITEWYRFFLICYLGGHCLHSQACGLSWQVPQDHFPGVNGHGFVSYFDKLSELDLGQDLKLPLIINFDSSNEKSSPYLGKSFTLFLLESNIVQNSDNSFMATFPDGSLNLFIRDNVEDTVLKGSAGWKGEISGDTINVYAPCGWKITYYKGRILCIVTPTNRKLEYVYSGQTVTAIRENGDAKLTVEENNDGEGKVLSFNGGHTEITLGQKPRVQNIAGQNVIEGIDRTLKTIKLASGINKNFEFAVNDKIQPTLKITGASSKEQLFIWNPVNKLIISDNDWQYNIVNGANVNSNAAIERSSVRRGNEYWFYDHDGEQEVSRGLDGRQSITKWFTSGILQGKLREKETVTNGVMTIVYRASYDESGALIRETFVNGDVITYQKNKNGTTMIKNGVPYMSTVHNVNGTIAKEIFYDQKTEKLYSYENGMQIVDTYFADGQILEEKFDKMSKRMKSQYINN